MANGGCGYVKKPEFLIKVGKNGEVFDPNNRLPVKKILKVMSHLNLTDNAKVLDFVITLLLFSYLAGQNIHGRWLASRFQTHTL